MTKLLAAPLLLLLAAAPAPRQPALPHDLQAAIDDHEDAGMLPATCADYTDIRAGQLPTAQRAPLIAASRAWTERLHAAMPRVEGDQLAGSSYNFLLSGNSRTQIATAAAWCLARRPR